MTASDPRYFVRICLGEYTDSIVGVEFLEAALTPESVVLSVITVTWLSGLSELNHLVKSFATSMFISVLSFVILTVFLVVPQEPRELNLPAHQPESN